jgi:hypothetical protein
VERIIWLLADSENNRVLSSSSDFWHMQMNTVYGQFGLFSANRYKKNVLLCKFSQYPQSERWRYFSQQPQQSNVCGHVWRWNCVHCKLFFFILFIVFAFLIFSSKIQTTTESCSLMPFIQGHECWSLCTRTCLVKLSCNRVIPRIRKILNGHFYFQYTPSSPSCSASGGCSVSSGSNPKTSMRNASLQCAK